MNREIRMASALLVVTGLLGAVPVQAFAKAAPAVHRDHSRGSDHKQSKGHHGGGSSSQGSVDAALLAGTLDKLITRDSAQVNTAEAGWLAVSGGAGGQSVTGSVYGGVPQAAQGTLSALQSDMQTLNSELSATPSMSQLLSTLKALQKDASALREAISSSTSRENSALKEGGHEIGKAKQRYRADLAIVKGDEATLAAASTVSRSQAKRVSKDAEHYSEATREYVKLLDKFTARVSGSASSSGGN